MPLLVLPCASKNLAFLCVMACVFYVSKNRGESEKKRENLTHGNKNGLVNQLFTRPFSARDEIRTHTPFRALPPQSSASTNFATAPFEVGANVGGFLKIYGYFFKIIRKVVPLPGSELLINISPL